MQKFEINPNSLKKLKKFYNIMEIRIEIKYLFII